MKAHLIPWMLWFCAKFSKSEILLYIFCGTIYCSRCILHICHQKRLFRSIHTRISFYPIFHSIQIIASNNFVFAHKVFNTNMFELLVLVFIFNLLLVNFIYALYICCLFKFFYCFMFFLYLMAMTPHILILFIL